MSQIKAYGLILYKIEEECIKVLLCKSVKSYEKWGCLKGVQSKSESAKECAKREFFEESSIKIDTYLFEDFFFQENSDKDIGIWLVNSKKLPDVDKYFFKETLIDKYLSWENSKVKYFDIKNLPILRKKQKKLINEIKDFLQNKHQSH